MHISTNTYNALISLITDLERRVGVFDHLATLIDHRVSDLDHPLSSLTVSELCDRIARLDLRVSELERMNE
jgi:hypothetical protein